MCKYSEICTASVNNVVIGAHHKNICFGYDIVPTTEHQKKSEAKCYVEVNLMICIRVDLVLLFLEWTNVNIKLRIVCILLVS